ncbi:zinc transporter ZupT [Caulifigura coniformis]|uniref:Zinc transporter ZupT n=1 Tax=Caulifigura coniformis TaxID=2527983 RepID=A0A517S8D7_9PLAN|nr:ZIP family metal transporter [Caulifigura coniformis]QDT52391.1 zinc transporter ZupT [Caulifigura coniformis]
MIPVLVVFSLLIVVASLAGGFLPAIVRLTHLRLQLMISFVGGLMLGVSLFQMVPHAIQELGADRASTVGLSVFAGLATMFMLLRMFHFHHHDTTGAEDDKTPVHHHDHDHDCDRHGPPIAASRMSGLGVFIGLALHTLIDGVALAAALKVASSEHNAPGALAIAAASVGTFLAILFHKPLDAVSITSLMSAGGWSSRGRLMVNLAFSMMCPLGAAIYLMGASSLPFDHRLMTGAALAFSAGVFLCISLSDLLPEIEFHSHNRIGLTFALVGGVGLSYLISLLDAGHLH